MLRGDQPHTVSVIVPNYNHAPFLAQRMASIFDQTYTNYEVVLLDDASDDGSPELLQEYAEDSRVSHLVLNEQNSGSPFAQWQKGIGLAKGEFIWIAESDDYCEPEMLKTLMVPLLADDRMGISYCQSVDVGQPGQQDRLEYTAAFNPNIWVADFTMDGKEFIREYLFVKNVIPNASGVVFRRSLLEHVDFNPMRNLRMAGDWLFWLQLCQHTWITFSAKPLNYFRTHPGVSRKHHTRELKLERIKEEYYVRQYVGRQYSLDQERQLKKLYGKWLLSFTLKHLFSSTFYALSYRGKTFRPKVTMAIDLVRSSVGRWL